MHVGRKEGRKERLDQVGLHIPFSGLASWHVLATQVFIYDGVNGRVREVN